MMQRSLGFSICALTLLASASALAASVEMPLRKAGLWEIHMQHEGSKLPDVAIQQCTSEAIDREFTSEFAPAAKQNCTKNDIQKTATGYVSDSVCAGGGATITSHAETSGDFNSAYNVKVTSHSEGGKLGTHDSTMTLTAKWVDACKADQKPGDIVMPGGLKMNMRDLQKFKAMVPK